MSVNDRVKHVSDVFQCWIISTAWHSTVRRGADAAMRHEMVAHSNAQSIGASYEHNGCIDIN